MANLEQRVAALEQQAGVTGEILILRIAHFGADGRVNKEVQRFRASGDAGQSWDRQSGETEDDFMARAEQEARRVGVKVLVGECADPDSEA